MLKEVFILDNEGFVPEDINLGQNNGKKRVKVMITVLEAPKGKDLPQSITEEYSLDRQGFISNDLALDPEMAGARVEVAISLI